MSAKIHQVWEDEQEIPLSETTKFIVDNRGKTAPTAESGIPLIATNCINNNHLYPTYDTVRFVSRDTYENWFRAHPEPGDIILTLKGSQNGAVCLAPNPVDFVIAQDMVALRADESVIEPLFLFAALRSPSIQYQIKALDVSGVIPHFKKSDFDKLFLPYPNRNMQEFIGKFYFTLSKKIDLLHRQNKTLEALAQTLFRHWFVDGAGDDWAEHKLEEFVEVMRGLSYKGAGLRDGVDGVPMHNLNSVYEGGGYKYEGIKYYDGPYQERHKIFPGDIIITNTEQGHNFLLIGYPAVVPRIFGDEGIFSQHIYRLNIFNPQISNQFLYYLLMSFDVREQIIGATNGSTVNMLPKDGIEWATFKLPPQNLVNQFSDMAQQYWDKREANYLQIRTLEKLRDTLLPKLMSGEARVSAVSEIAKLESHELFDRAGYLAAMFADAVQPVAAGTAKARTGWQESNIPLAWFAIPETLYQLSEQPFPTLIGQTIYQKLCYVLTDEGVNTGFTFVQHNYGPHSSDAVQALARLETMGVIAQVSVGRMTELRVQALYRAQRTRILEELKQFQPMIARTVELFNHVKDTDHAEEIATILYSARQIEQKLAQRNIPRNELHEYMLTWKPHWNRGNKRERLDRAINGLVKMGFIVIQ